MPLITHIHAIEILDSRGNPSLEVDVIADDGSLGRAAVPSGASTGHAEALELRVGNQNRYNGKGVLQAVNNVNGTLYEALVGIEITDQIRIDRTLLDIDGKWKKVRSRSWRSGTSSRDQHCGPAELSQHSSPG